MPGIGTDGNGVRLSSRELEVAGMVAQGLTNREIAAKLYISERTVDGHLEHIREKLGVNTRSQVTAWVVRREAAGIAAPAAAPAIVVGPRRWAFFHPRAWLAAALVLALLAAGVGVLRLTAPPPPIIQTVAGSQCAQQVYPGGCYGGDNQRAVDAKLARPTSVAVDRHGVIYIADYGNHRIRKVVNGVITTVVGGEGKDELANGVLGISVSLNSLGYASAVTVDSQDRLHLLTSRDGVLEVWRLEGGFMYFVATLGRSNVATRRIAANLPVGGLAMTSTGTLFVADRAGNRVMIIIDGKASLYAGTGEAGMTDGGDAKSAQLNWPIGLALDRQENLYIADTGNNRIRRVDRAKGIITTVAGSGEFEGASGDDGPATQARLSFPFGVAVAYDGTLLIADTGNHRLREVTPDGKISALAGTGRWGFFGDGRPVLEAEFVGPEGLALDSKGNLFIADTENQRVREIARIFGLG